MAEGSSGVKSQVDRPSTCPMPGPRHSSRQAIQGACQAAASPKSRPETRLCGPVCTSVVCSETVTPCFFGVPARAQGTPAAWKRGASPRIASHPTPGRRPGEDDSFE